MSFQLNEYSDTPKIVPWVPVQTLKSYESDQVKFSGGFLRSRPERWFPGFSAHWLPLAHALGIETQLVEIKPLLVIPPALEHVFVGRVGSEQLAIGLDAESARVVSEAIAPGSRDSASQIVIEYLMRRFLSTAAMAWSGEDTSSISFTAMQAFTSADFVGSIKLTIMVNNYHCTVWTMLSQGLVSRFDGLWKRQVNAQARGDISSGLVQIEIGHIGVDPTSIGDYVRADAVIDLEVPISDQVLLRIDGKPWIMSRLGLINDFFAFESLSSPVSHSTLAPHLTKILVQLDEVSLSNESLSELSQPGAVVQSPLSAGNKVRLIVQQDTVAHGTLCVYDGRWAVQVTGSA